MKLSHYLAAVSEEEPDAVVPVAPLQVLVVRGKVESESGRAQEPVQFWGIYERRYPTMSFWRHVSPPAHIVAEATLHT